MKMSMQKILAIFMSEEFFNSSFVDFPYFNSYDIECYLGESSFSDKLIKTFLFLALSSPDFCFWYFSEDCRRPSIFQLLSLTSSIKETK